MQSRLSSFLESLINIAIGFAINMIANLAIFPLFGYAISFTTNLKMGIIYTVISIVRSYTIRRWFNARIHKLAERVANDQSVS